MSDKSASDAFLRSIELPVQKKGQGGPPLAQLQEARTEAALADILKRNDSLTADALARWEQRLLQEALLSDVRPNASLAEIEALLARELGTGLTVVLVRMDGERVPLAIAPGFTVRELKARTQTVLAARYEQPGVMGIRKISWKQVWAGHCLTHAGERLLDDAARLDALGIGNGAEIHFARYNAKKAAKDARPKRQKRRRRDEG